MAASLTSRARPPAGDPRRYWAPCLGVALVAMSFFYATLKDLVNESAARAALLTTAVVPAQPEPERSAGRETTLPDAMPRASPAPVTLTNTNFEPPVIAPAAPAAKAAPTVAEVHKCVMPEGNAAYSDGPCPAGAHETTLRLPRAVHATASL